VLSVIAGEEEKAIEHQQDEIFNESITRKKEIEQACSIKLYCCIEVHHSFSSPWDVSHLQPILLFVSIFFHHSFFFFSILAFEFCCFSFF
jgi:hypothetical protein